MPGSNMPNNRAMPPNLLGISGISGRSPARKRYRTRHVQKPYPAWRSGGARLDGCARLPLPETLNITRSFW